MGMDGKTASLRKELSGLLDAGRLPEAWKLCADALAAGPESPELLRLAGIVRLRQGRGDDALKLLRRGVELAPENPALLSALASALVDSGSKAEAIETLKACLRFDPGREAELDCLMNLHLDCGDIDSARSCVQAALEKNLKCPSSTARLAVLELDHGNPKLAFSLFAKALEWDPSNLFALDAFASALTKRGDYLVAASVLEALAKAQPGVPLPLVNLSACLIELGRFDEAIARLDEAARLSDSSQVSAAILTNKGTALYKMGRLEDSISVFKEALPLGGKGVWDAGFALSLPLLKSGRFKEAWPYWERRLEQPAFSNIAGIKLPRWTPDCPPGAKVLVRCEQGFGDSVNYSRFIPLLRERCGHLAFLCRKELAPLFEGFPGIDRLVVLGSAEPESLGCEFLIPLASLPGHFLDSIDSISALGFPSLKAPEAKLAFWKDVVEGLSPKGARLKAGLCWSGSQENLMGRMRSIPPEALNPLLALEDVAWFSLQQDALARPASFEGRVTDLSGSFEDFGDTAALISNLDLVVSVDTAVAHLAGSMGKPVLLALCTESDWRWFVDRSDSPWYPSARLFRQRERGVWRQPLLEIAESLSSTAAE